MNIVHELVSRFLAGLCFITTTSVGRMTQNLWAYFNDIFGTGSEKSVSVSTAPAARRLSVTEMGDRVATIDMGQKVWGLLCLLPWGSLVPK